MFQDNKYTKWYFSIIDKAKSETRTKDNGGYFEEHHITPRSLGGPDRTSNLVLLTYREHFIAHWLLIKAVTPEHKIKMQRALSKMIQATKYVKRNVSSWQYELARKSVSDAMRNRVVSDQTRKKVSEYAKTRVGDKNSFFGKSHTDENKKILSAQKKGENNPFYGKKRPEHSTRMKQVMKGKTKSDEHKRNISKTWHETHTKCECEHCGLSMAKHMYTRWHGPKCKRAALNG